MLKTTTPLREPDLSIRLYKALAECLRERNAPLTYGAARQLITDAELLRLHNVGKGTVAEWTAFKAANPVLPEAPDNVITEDTPKADSAEMLRWTIDQMRAQMERDSVELKRTQASNDYMRKRISTLEERIEAITASLTVAQLRSAGLEVTVEFMGDD